MRQDWDTYFLEIAKIVSTRATCPRRSVGCVITNNNKIISTGYNGSARNEDHCTHECGCLLNESDHCIRTIHAEMNAVIQAQCNLQSCKIYCTDQPCLNCTKLIVGCGIQEIHFVKPYECKERDLYIQSLDTGLTQLTIYKYTRGEFANYEIISRDLIFTTIELINGA